MQFTAQQQQQFLQDDLDRQTAERQALAVAIARQQSLNQAALATPRNAEGFATWVMTRFAGHFTNVRFASHVMTRTVFGPADDFAAHVRVRPAKTMPRLLRPWLRLLLEAQDEDAMRPHQSNLTRKIP